MSNCRNSSPEHHHWHSSMSFMPQLCESSAGRGRSYYSAFHALLKDDDMLETKELLHQPRKSRLPHQIRNGYLHNLDHRSWGQALLQTYKVGTNLFCRLCHLSLLFLHTSSPKMIPVTVIWNVKPVIIDFLSYRRFSYRSFIYYFIIKYYTTEFYSQRHTM